MFKSKQNRLLTWIVAILIILNGIVLFMLWHSHDSDFQVHMNAVHPVDKEHMENELFLHQELVFTEEQQLLFKDIRDEYFKLNQSHLHEIHLIREKVTHAALQDSPNIERIRSWSDSLGSIMAQKELARFKHFIAVKAICTPEQLDRFEDFLEDVLHQNEPHSVDVDYEHNEEHEVHHE